MFPSKKLWSQVKKKNETYEKFISIKFKDIEPKYKAKQVSWRDTII